MSDQQKMTALVAAILLSGQSVTSDQQIQQALIFARLLVKEAQHE